MRKVSTLLSVAFLITALAACGDDGGSGGLDIGGGDPADTDGGEPDAEDPGPDVEDPTPDAADGEPDAAGPVDTGDAEPDAEPDVIEPDCVEDDDCKFEVDLDTCEVAVCNVGVCEAEEVDDCCATDADCVGAVALTGCQEAVCDKVGNLGECVAADLDDCCLTDEDCGDAGDGCCTIATCNAQNTCTVVELDNCCGDSGDCDDGSAVTTDVCSAACVDNGCLNVPPACEEDKVFLNKGFGDGTLQLLKVSDSQTGDDVGIAPVKGDSVNDHYALYFGDPACQTYYNGPMAGCVPTDPFASESTQISLELETLPLVLDDDAGAYLGFWLKMAAEPQFEVEIDGVPMFFDSDYLVVRIDDGTGVQEIWRSTNANALGPDNSTGGTWSYQVANLSSWAGKSVALTFAFKTDATGNWNNNPAGEKWFGALLDDIKVRTTCEEAACDAADPSCPDDFNSCTANNCTLYGSGSGGVCGFQTATPGESCQSCFQAGDCGSDPCFAYACVQGQCQIDQLPECCEASSTFPVETLGGEVAYEGFEDGNINDWTVDDPYPTDNVTWTTTAVLPYGGTWSLYFGDESTQSYLSDPPNPALATAWTPWFDVDEDDFRTPVASFWLWMSTEYDGAVALPEPDEAFDVLEIYAQASQEGDEELVWSSAQTIGNSTKGEWAQIGVDLGEFKGGTIRLGFRFDSGDGAGQAIENDHGGVRIDDLTVSSVCGGDPCITSSDCDDGNACSADWCDLGECVNSDADPLCCVVDNDCDHDNNCVEGACEEGTCVFSYPAEGSPKLNSCCSEAAWLGQYTASFEDGDDGFVGETWTPPVQWHVTSDDAYDGLSSYNFTDPASGNFVVANSDANGVLWSSPIVVPPFTQGRPYAEFWFRLETEWDVNDADFFDPLFVVDELRVHVAVDGEYEPSSPQFVEGEIVMVGDTKWFSWYLTNTTQGGWVKTRVDLGEFRGEEVQLVFEFASGDKNSNDFAGPFIDGVTFGATCKPAGAIKCLYGGDCEPSDDCKVALCGDDFKCVQTPKTTPECCEPAVIPAMTLDFESNNPAAGWTFTQGCDASLVSPGVEVDSTVTWQVGGIEECGGVPPKSGFEQLCFSNGVDYGGANNMASCGEATSPVISLDDGVPWDLTFWANLDVEKTQECFGGGANFSDVVFVEVILPPEEGGFTESLWSKTTDVECSEYGMWIKVTHDLTPYAGMDIQLLFHFHSWDNIENEGAGIAFDSFEFTRGCEVDFE